MNMPEPSRTLLVYRSIVFVRTSGSRRPQFQRRQSDAAVAAPVPSPDAGIRCFVGCPGHSRSLGAAHRGVQLVTHAYDLTGQTFGWLTVLSRAGRTSSKAGFATWNCQCSCGRKTVSAGVDLRNGRIKSCGCKWRTLRRQKALKFRRFKPVSVTPDEWDGVLT